MSITLTWLATFRVTGHLWGHLRLMSSTFSHMTSVAVMWQAYSASYSLSCKVQARSSPNAPKTQVFRPLETLLYFRSDDVTYGSLEVTFGHVPSHHAIWLPLPVSYRLAAAEMQRKREYTGIPGPVGAVPIWWHYLRVTWGHFWSHECKLQACCCSKAPECKYLALPKLCEVSSSLTMPLLGPGSHFHSYDITFGLMTRFSCTLQTCRSSNAPRTYFGIPNPCEVTSSAMTSLLGHVRPLMVTWHCFWSCH